MDWTLLTQLGQPFLSPCSLSGLWSDLWAQHPLQPVVAMVWLQTLGLCVYLKDGTHSTSAGKISLIFLTPLGTSPISREFPSPAEVFIVES